MGFNVKDKVCIVTGSAQGIGEEIARRLLNHGAKVCISDINETRCEETALKFQEHYGKDHVTFSRCDVSKQSDWDVMWEHTETVFEDKVEVLVNNAGLNPSAGWKPCLDVMLNGVMVGSFKARENMGSSKGGKGGRIINVASMAGLSVKPPRGPDVGGFDDIGYNVSKHGVVTLTRYFATCGPQTPWTQDKIKAYAICPFYTDTGLLREDTKGDNSVIEGLTKCRVMTPFDIGNGFDQTLEVDENGSAWVVFPDIPVFQYPEFNGSFLLPMVMFIKLISFLKPDLQRINGRYAASGLFLMVFFILYILLAIIF